MKIAFVYDLIYPYSIGGIEVRNWQLAKRLVKKGHQVTLFGTKLWGGEDAQYREGVRFWGVGHPRPLYSGDHRSIVEAILYSINLPASLMKERFDVINIDNFPYFPCFPARLISLLNGSKFVIAWHEVWGNYWYEYLGWRGLFGQIIERTVVYLTGDVIAVSAGTKERLHRMRRASIIKLIPNGVDRDIIDRCGPAQEKSDIIYSGRLIKEKNVDLLIRAVNIVRQIKPDIRCVIIGNGPEKESLQSLCTSLNLDGNIVFKDFLEKHEDLFSYMKSSRVFTLPSQREGFGIVIVEANACGIPAVTLNHPRNEARNLIQPGNGFVCDLNPQDMAAAIVRALSSDLTRSSIEFACEYDWDTIAEKLEEYYLGLTK